MAQGCINFVTNTDIQNKDKNKKTLSDKERKKSIDDTRNGLDKYNKQELIKVNSNPGSKQYKIVDRNLKTILAKGLKPKDANNLMDSLAILNKHNPNNTGLFSKVPRKGVSYMSQGYELIGTSSIISKGKIGIKTSLGKSLIIKSTDHLNFGAKHDSDETTKKGNKGTVESDLLIHKGDEEIGVDFKYTRLDKNVSLSGKNFIRQLKGVKSALSDGQIHEYHFVSNRQFTVGTKKTITNTNVELIKNSLFQDELDIIDKSYTNEINKTLNSNKTTLENCSLNSGIMQQLYKINTKYGRPQIGVSENVNLE